MSIARLAANVCKCISYCIASHKQLTHSVNMSPDEPKCSEELMRAGSTLDMLLDLELLAMVISQLGQV